GCTFGDCLSTHTLNEIFVNASANDYHLKTSVPISPAIDKGTNNFGSPELVPSTDFEGNPRPQDGDGDATATVDIGYDEAPAVVITYTVTPSSSGNGSINPSTPQTVNSGSTTAFTLTPDPHYHIASVTGTCGGSLVSNTFTTAAVTANC